MATIEPRKTRNGKITRYRVKWRTGGTRAGEWDGRTFDSHAEAKTFKALIDAYGQTMPPDEVLVARGFGYLAATVQLVNAGDAAEEAPPAITFEEYARGYIDRLVRPNRETKRKYLERLVTHVFPVIGDRPIAAITRGEMRRWQDGLIGKLSPKTIQNIRGESVSPIFDAACLAGEDDEPPLRSYNPLKGLQLPEKVRAPREIVEDRSEARVVIEAAYEVDPEAADLMVMLLSTGMRWGEATAVPVRSVNFDRGTVSIQQVMRREHFRWVLVLKPKTEDGYREIPVPAPVLEMLRARCEGRAPDAFVFTAPRGGPWVYETFYEDRWVKIRDMAERKGLKKRMTMYGFRHSLLTWLASEGVNLIALRTIAGHKNVSTTFNFYVHNTRKHHPQVKAVVDDLVGMGLRMVEERAGRGQNPEVD
ncbi:tyrosine-type recombinase/integrase [Catenuloplanes atrovinosus]|uniref:Integrase n=1 Tax=Catenuloplanes atrovinosus TaxID=137266 RepID=A0AAE3YRJ8_9ACTN|nr:tyrosine-type recombinase/integrase [Catenuloplanes atrovinosus]MDR7277337.1 integrase [Catenuloplanes atrovinosus]